MQIRGPKLAMALLLVAFAALAAIGPAVASPVDRRALFTALPCPQLPVSTDGSCGPAVGLRCRDGFCCSGTGFCGAGDAWCTDTCQVGYGECHVSEQPLAVVCVTATSKATTATTRSGAPANSPGASTKTQPGPSSATRSTAGLLTTAPVNLPSGTSSPRPTPPPVPKSSWDGPQVGAYFAQWGVYARKYRVKDIETSGSAGKLTFVNYAFGNIYEKDGAYECGIVNRMESGRGDGGDAWADFGKGYSTSESVDGVADTWDDPLAGSFGQLRRLKMMHPGLKVLISLGGWTWSKHFSAAGATDALRKRLVKSCIDLYIRGNLPVIDGRGGPGTGAGVFDGIDIDWEYPGILGLDYNSVSPEDGARFELLLQEFRAQLDAAGAELGGRYFGLTSAVGAGDDKIKGTDPSKYTKQLDWLLLMSYDYFGGWDASGPTDCHSILFSDPASPHVTNTSTGLPSKFAQYNTDSALRNIMAAGAPPSKIVMGLPFYGRGWTGVAKGTGTYPGLYQAATGPAPGKIEAGIEDYKVLKALTAPVSVHPVTKQSFVYDESARTFWSYDTPAVIGTKVVYAKEKKLKGVFAWSLDGDTEDGELVSAMAAFASG